MKLEDFIKLESIYVDVDVDSKKNLFKYISNVFSKSSSVNGEDIIDKLNQRERLGSTGVGNGVAIPHSKINLLQETKVFFFKLKSAIDFSSADKKHVDLVFVILAPNNSQSEHLLVLSSISSFLRNKTIVKQLRNLKKPTDIMSFFSKFSVD